MGNKPAESKALIDFSLEETIYKPGDTIKGKIEILFNDQNIVDKFTNPQIKCFIIQSRVWHISIYTEDNRTNINGSTTITPLIDNHSEEEEENKFEGIKKAFTFKIPDNITPSLEWPNKKNEFAFIRNYFCVQVPELKIQKEILILIQKLPDLSKRLLKVAKEEAIKKAFKKDGKIRVEASYPQYSYPALSTIPLTVAINAIDNEVVLKEVTVSLKRLLEFNYKKSNKVDKKVLQFMYRETIKINENKKNLLFKIPFKDGKEIDFCFSKSMYKSKDEVSCILPNVKTDIIKVSYYIKIIVVLHGLLNKNIPLKLGIDFQSKGEDNANEDLFDNFGDTVVKINKGKIPIENDWVYMKYNPNMENNDINLNDNLMQLKKSAQEKFYNRRSSTPEAKDKNFDDMKIINIDNSENNLNKMQSKPINIINNFDEMNNNINNNMNMNEFNDNMINMDNFGQNNFNYDDSDLPSMAEVEKGHNLNYMNFKVDNDNYNNNDANLNYPDL